MWISFVRSREVIISVLWIVVQSRIQYWSGRRRLKVRLYVWILLAPERMMCCGLPFTNIFQGPFSSQQDFNAAIAEAFMSKSKVHSSRYVHGMLDSHKHKIVFTHGDLRPANIIIKDGRVAAILD